MNRIATTQELQAEIKNLLAYAQSKKPSREKLAADLTALAARVAGVKKEEIPESEQDSWKESLRRNKGKYHGPNGLKSGQKYKYQGKDWFILDFDAEAKAPGGSTLSLVSSDFKEFVRGVEVE
jgi:seryl-tRNA synthetase